ncbi:MAG: hypothetical protein D6696_05255, partial [Acidobacteria bacterium]
HDSAAPEVSSVVVRSGILEIEFTEEVDLAAAQTAIQIDGATDAWTLQPDRYALTAATPLASGTHQLLIAADPLDLAGKPLTEPFAVTFAVDANLEQQIIHQAPDPRTTATSTVANRFGFHGLHQDPETGLIYARNRYYDPELGRFITACRWSLRTAGFWSFSRGFV